MTSFQSTRPVTGPGNMVVISFLDHRNGQESSITFKSEHGTAPAEARAAYHLRQQGVPPQNVLAIHSDLRPGMCPGGYSDHLLEQLFPGVKISFTHEYGATPAQRATDIQALVEHVDMMHAVTGQSPPPRPHQPEMPVNVPPAPAISDEMLAQQMRQTFGPQGLRRYDPATVVASAMPEAAKNTILMAGLPTDVPFFFGSDRPEAPPAGGLFADAATHLRAQGTNAGETALDFFAEHVRIGHDGYYVITVQFNGDPDRRGWVWALHPDAVDGHLVNTSVSAFNRCMAQFVATHRQMRGMDPIRAGHTLVTLRQQLVALDPIAMERADQWWRVVLEQMWYGLY